MSAVSPLQRLMAAQAAARAMKQVARQPSDSTENAAPAPTLASILTKRMGESITPKPELVPAPMPEPEPEPGVIPEVLDATQFDNSAAEQALSRIDRGEDFDLTDSDADLAPDSFVETRETASVFNIIEGMNVVPDPSQVMAYQGLAREQMGCLIGAAGTGKTTTLRLLLNVLMNGDPSIDLPPVRIGSIDVRKYHEDRDNGELEPEEGEEPKESRPEDQAPAVAFVAFTGQAVQVMKRNLPRAWAKNCMTVHSLLGYAPVEFTNDEGKASIRFEPTFTKNYKMPWDIIIVDEASMLNIYLWHEMRDAAKDSCRFYFVGDLNQLPPVMGEGILGFALARLPTFELTVVHRQADEAANKIIDTAWHVLKGEKFTFDDPATNPNWRVLGYELPAEGDKAHQKIVSIAKGLSTKHVDNDPNKPQIYEPFRDRIMTAMNGYSNDKSSDYVGQHPLNESLSRIFGDKDEMRVVIDCKRVTKTFAVGYRVMATKNESPSRIDRVTNGLTGRIIEISENPNWSGDRRLVGNEDEVSTNRAVMVQEALFGKGSSDVDHIGEALDRFTFRMGTEKVPEEERQSGPCSHIVTVTFDNGATRMYNLNAQVEQLMLAYASTVHKTQGAEMPTAIVVVHHLQRKMLSRESLYTAVTRARERLIILYTDFGLRLALANQEVRGNTLQEKVKRYIELSGDGEASFRTLNVRLWWYDE
jgi:ATP-dependent exoDNAse (exonuclease V) alpha subunit